MGKLRRTNKAQHKGSIERFLCSFFAENINLTSSRVPRDYNSVPQCLRLCTAVPAVVRRFAWKYV